MRRSDRSSSVGSSSPLPRAECALPATNGTPDRQRTRRSGSPSGLLKISFGADVILGHAQADVDRSCRRVSSAAVFKTISTLEYRAIHQQRIEARHKQHRASRDDDDNRNTADSSTTVAAASSSAAHRPREAAPSPAPADAYCKFVAKRSSGPLERWCALCGRHTDRHPKRRALSVSPLRRTHGTRGVGK